MLSFFPWNATGEHFNLISQLFLTQNYLMIHRNKKTHHAGFERGRANNNFCICPVNYLFKMYIYMLVWITKLLISSGICSHTLM